MTLKKHNGKWSLGKMTMLTGIAASIATCIIALPTATDYCKKALAPWTVIPSTLSSMQTDIKEIKQRLMLVDLTLSTNKTEVAKH